MSGNRSSDVEGQFRGYRGCTAKAAAAEETSPLNCSWHGFDRAGAVCFEWPTGSC